jgi:hypothetical protein
VSTKVVHKHEVLTIDRPTDIPLGADSVVVHVGMQNGALYIWEEHNEPKSLRIVARRYGVFGTGQKIPDGGQYVGTAIDGPFVWHLYELDRTDEQ